ncbi:MAG: hypothetical protein IAE97_00465 [Chthoniobacterales bacterium]|nr:hypothetical protein [Chthoniobacterales bacterium]
MATAVFFLLAVVLASFASSTSAIWQQGIAHNDRRTAAMVMLAQMGRDLRNASLPADFNGGRLDFVINPPGVTHVMPQAIFWLAPSATVRTNGDQAVVGYFVRPVAEGTAPAIPKLCRVMVNPGAPNYPATDASANWITDAVLDANAPASQAGNYAGQLAENVLGLWVRPLDQVGETIRTNAAGTAFPAGAFDSSEGYRSSEGVTYQRALPSSIEVAIVVIDARTAKKLTGAAAERPQTSTDDFWSDIHTFYNSLPAPIKKGAQIYSTVFPLVVAPKANAPQ